MTETHASHAANQPKTMALRYAGTCQKCGAAIAAATVAIYFRESRSVQCIDCDGGARATQTLAPSATTTDGTAGASARREYEKRHDARESRIRTNHPRIGGLLLALSDDPQSTKAWAVGAIGEERLGEQLDRLIPKGIRTLHDRRIPGTKANIDHIAIAPSGVYVIDAKRYRDQRPSLRIEGGFLRPRREFLMIGSRDRTSLVDGALKQIAVVRAVLDAAGLAAMPVHGTLCFVDADFPLIGGDFTVRTVMVAWPRKVGATLAKAGEWEELVGPAFDVVSSHFLIA